MAYVDPIRHPLDPRLGELDEARRIGSATLDFGTVWRARLIARNHEIEERMREMLGLDDESYDSP